ncbi:DUF2231 domain-containing protein [Adhaeribacter terreus]|uniref:DUF2231 domain-containing protein n=1 Tax=Adhaeribacter terreus TaxID=529703 RepID=A0ABW0E620_9BACT
MNDTYLHLTLTHFPIVGSFIALVLLFSGYIQKNEGITKAALYLLVALALVTIVVNHTGEEAEEFVEHMAGYSHDAIHDHEEMAEWAFRLMLATGIGAAVALYLFRKNAAKTWLVVLLVLFGNLFACGLMAWTGKKGGEIRHTEVNSVAEKTAPTDSNSPSEQPF